MDRLAAKFASHAVLTGQARDQGGYSLTEMLVVLAIIGILAIVGVSTLGDRKSNAVRTVMDEVEGVLQGAQQTCAVSAVDIPLSAYGTWTSSGSPLTLDGRRISGTSYPADATAGMNTARIGATSEVFVSRFTSSRSHMSAAVVSDPSWISNALGGAPNLATVPPCDSEPFKSALANPLFANGSPNMIRINGMTKRFEAGFYVAVVGLAEGYPSSDSAVGYLVVPANSSTVYRFYKPANSTTWLRQ